MGVFGFRLDTVVEFHAEPLLVWFLEGLVLVLRSIEGSTNLTDLSRLLRLGQAPFTGFLCYRVLFQD